MGSYVAKPSETTSAWYIIDATDRSLGRMAASIATVLMGKHKPTYTAFIDTGDHVVVTHAAKVRIHSEKRPRERMIRYHTGWFGNLKETSLSDAFAKNPEKVVMLAVRRMLPKTKMGKQMLSKLKVYSDAEHQHAAQKPEPFPAWV